MAASKAATLSWSECQCHLCMEILIEPVTFPCSHTVCKPCFLALLRKIELYCPFCRFCISSWARAHIYTRTLINSELWAAIQKRFPRECRLRASGQETGPVFERKAPIHHVLSNPGELRREYEEEKSKMEAELKANKEEEEKATAEYIQTLLAEEEKEEEKLWAEKRQRDMEEQLKREEEERKLSMNNPVPIATPRKRKYKEKHVEYIPTQSQIWSTSGYEVQEVGNMSSKKIDSKMNSPTGQDLNIEENMPRAAPQISLDIEKQVEKFPIKSPMPSLYVYEVEQDLQQNVPRSSSWGAESSVPIKKAKPEAAAGSDQTQSDTESNVSEVNPESSFEAIEHPCVSAKGKEMFPQSFSAQEEAKISVMEKMLNLEQLYFEKHQQEERDRIFALQLQKEIDEEMMQSSKRASPDIIPIYDLTILPNSPEREDRENSNEEHF